MICGRLHESWKTSWPVEVLHVLWKDFMINKGNSFTKILFCTKVMLHWECFMIETSINLISLPTYIHPHTLELCIGLLHIIVKSLSNVLSTCVMVFYVYIKLYYGLIWWQIFVARLLRITQKFHEIYSAICILIFSDLIEIYIYQKLWSLCLKIMCKDYQ